MSNYFGQISKKCKKSEFFRDLGRFTRKSVCKKALLPRVRDWKGYGIMQLCGTCEPLQSPTDVALEMRGSAELWRERPNKNSRTKYYDSSHADEQDARHPEEPATGLKKNGGLSLQIHFMSGFGLRFVLPSARAMRKGKRLETPCGNAKNKIKKRECAN